MFKQGFGKYVVVDDYITCTVDGYECIATVHYDDDTTPPDQRCEGFWPSLNPEDAGYIGAKSKRSLARERAHMQEFLDTWKRDEWHYVGVTVNVWKDDVCLTPKYEHSLWGLEANCPVRRKGSNPNHYLMQVANDLLPYALTKAKAKVASLCQEKT